MRRVNHSNLFTKSTRNTVGKVKPISRGMFKSILSHFNSNTPLAPWDFLQRGRVPNNSWLGTSSMCMLLLEFLPKLWNLLNGILHRVVQEFNELFPKESSVSQEMWEERLLVVWKTNKVWGICLCLTVKFQLVSHILPFQFSTSSQFFKNMEIVNIEDLTVLYLDFGTNRLLFVDRNVFWWIVLPFLRHIFRRK